MLTPDDYRSDGHRILYLSEPEKWRHFDAPIFDLLRTHVIERQHREVRAIEEAALVPNCSFFPEIIPVETTPREEFMGRFLMDYQHADLMFFDPDNGLEVKSVPYGKKNCSKYLYYSEVENAVSRGHSVLIYQHLSPRSRGALALQIGRRLTNISGGNQIFLYWTQFVVFFLIVQHKHLQAIQKANSQIARDWGGQIRIENWQDSN